MPDNKDDFVNTVNTVMAPPEKELPGSFPKSKSQTFKAKYARFYIGDDGCPELEEIINKCINGTYILASEQQSFTKEGDVIVVVKYLIPEDQKAPERLDGAIKGIRRLKKALAKDQK